MLPLIAICWFRCIVFYIGSLLSLLGIRGYKLVGHVGTFTAYYRTLFFKVYPVTLLWGIKSVLWVRNSIKKRNGKVNIRVHYKVGNSVC